MYDPPVKKTVIGSPAASGAFQFKLEALDHSFPMPEGASDGVKNIRIIGEGENVFGTWSYVRAGVYGYTVSEVNMGEAGYRYDDAVYMISDVVTNYGGQLIVTRAVTDSRNERVDVMAFTNTYNPVDQTQAAQRRGVDGPKTGDAMNAALYYIIFILGGIFVICAAILLFKRDSKSRMHR